MNEVHFPSVFNEQVEVTSWHCSNVSDCHLYWCHLTIDMTQRMPSYVRSSHSPWHIPSKSLVTCDTPQLANQRPGSCHVTRSQPIRGECDLVSGWHGASALSGESSIWSLISVECGQWYCVSIRDQGTRRTPHGGPKICSENLIYTQSF